MKRNRRQVNPLLWPPLFSAVGTTASEEELQRELQNPRIERGLHLSIGGRAQVRAHGSEARLTRGRNRSDEIRIVKQIESFRSYLDGIPFGELEDSAQGDIDIHRPRSPQRIASQIPEGAERVGLERQRIEPLN